VDHRATWRHTQDAAEGLELVFRGDAVAAKSGERQSRTWRRKTFPEVGECAEVASYV
jgi:hypothetical protein